MLPITANLIEFPAKRRADDGAMAALDGGEPRERLLVKRYRQTKKIEQLLHVSPSIPPSKPR